MNVLPKVSNRFHVYFERFGSGDKLHHLTAQVLRVTRPHMLKYNVYGTGGIKPIEIDLRDDMTDITRTEVLTQLSQQNIHDVTFGLRIETLNRNEQVLERWHLDECRIVDCHFDELTPNPAGLLVRLQLDVKSVSVNIDDQMVVMVDRTANSR